MTAAAAAAVAAAAAAAADASGGEQAHLPAEAEECFEIVALEVWAVDTPRARALPSCARHGLLPSV